MSRIALRAVQTDAPENPFTVLERLIDQRDRQAEALAAIEREIATAMLTVRTMTTDYERRVRGRLS